MLPALIMSIFIATTLLPLCGCSVVEPISPDNIMKNPLGADSVKVGMSKAQVESLWGKPDYVSTVEDQKRWKGSREVWVYRGREGSIPVNADYLSRTKKLYFDGDNLTNISEQ
jgi:outer membrane protein assembly factor BamE (lipoprotein component of BamABCDE complex)